MACEVLDRGLYWDLATEEYLYEYEKLHYPNINQGGDDNELSSYT